MILISAGKGVWSIESASGKGAAIAGIALVMLILVVQLGPKDPATEAAEAAAAEASHDRAEGFYRWMLGVASGSGSSGSSAHTPTTYSSLLPRFVSNKIGFGFLIRRIYHQLHPSGIPQI